MSRRRTVQTRTTLPDPRYSSVLVSKFIMRMMLHGKKSTSSRIMYDAMSLCEERGGKSGLEIFGKAIENAKPLVEVKSRRVGGSTYQIPIEVRDSRREVLAMRWIIKAARNRTGASMSKRLSLELLDAYNKTGTAIKKKEDGHRMAEANRAFAHYRW